MFPTSWIVLAGTLLCIAAATGGHPEAGRERRDSGEDETHTCIHDQVPENTAFVTTTSSERTKRSPRQGVTDAEPIRIKFHLVEESIASEIDPFREELVDSLYAAADYLAGAVQLRRLTEPLLLMPPCTSRGSSCDECECESVSTSLTCGDLVTVPEEHIGTRTVCNDSQCVEAGNADSPGVEAADLLVYVTAIDTGLCSSASLVAAYASHCMLDPDLYNRPIVGYINICPTNILSVIRTFTQDQILFEGKRLFTHELLHVMGFSNSLFEHFVDGDGESQTVWGEEVNRGKTFSALVLPTVVEKAKEHFGCDSLNGIIFSNTTSHWSRALMLPEVMVRFSYPSYSHLSQLTLALLKDTGWYEVDYTVAQTTVNGRNLPFIFGKGLGCDFLREDCRTTANPYDCYELGSVRNETAVSLTCTYDGLGKGICSIISDFSLQCFYTLPASNQGCNDPAVPVYSFHEVIGSSSICLMSNAGIADSTYWPQCLSVTDTVSDGARYALKAPGADGDIFGDVYCTSTSQKISVEGDADSDESAFCPHLEAVEGSFPAEPADELPVEVCHSSCGRCSRIEDPSACLSCAYSNQDLDGPPPSTCGSWRPQYSIRVVDGDSSQSTVSGTVQVFDRGVWRNVCTDNWNEVTAGTVCRQLGYCRVDDFYVNTRDSDEGSERCEDSEEQGSARPSICEDQEFEGGESLSVSCDRVSDHIDDCEVGDEEEEGCDVTGEEAGITCSGQFLDFEEFIGYPFDSRYSRLNTTSLYSYAPADIVDVPPNQKFPYFGQTMSALQVTQLGYVGFSDERSNLLLPRDIPFNSTASDNLVAALWSDVRFSYRHSRFVSYRSFSRASHPDIFRQIDATIQSRALQECNSFEFEAQWALVVTWDSVSGADFNSLLRPETSTFQLVLVTDWTFSFAIYNYAKGMLNWFHSAGSGFSVAGYNTANGEGHLNLPGSGTSGVGDLDGIKGNTGRGGQWVYKIDDDGRIVCGNCRPPLGISVFPKSIATLGGTAVRITTPGDCLETNDTISCTFGGAAVVVGAVVSPSLALCPSPALLRPGLVQVTVVVRRQGQGLYRWSDDVFGYPAVQSHEVDAFDSDDSSDKADLLLFAGKTMRIEWPQNFLFFKEPSEYTVDVKLIEFDTYSFLPKERATLGEGISNTGTFQVSLPALESRNGQDATFMMFQVSVNSTSASLETSEPVAKWTGFYFYRTGSDKDLEASCSSWEEEQVAAEKDEEGERLEILSSVRPCPPTEGRARLPNSGFQRIDYSSKIGRTSYADLYWSFFSPRGASFYTETATAVGPVQDCHYDENGFLLVGPSSGGTLDLYGVSEWSSHFVEDVFPLIYCCKSEFSRCGTYYEHRPSDNGSRFIITPPARLFGDPHIVTLDGFKYTFNGHGEFVLLETANDALTLQGRMVPASTVNSTAVSATVFSALVAQTGSSSRVQIELKERLEVRVDGQVFDVAEGGRLVFTGVTVSRAANETVSAVFSTGALVEVQAVVGEAVDNPWISTITISLPDSLRGTTSGLMGPFNGDTSDDLSPRSGGAALALDSFLSDIHWNFGITWIIANATDSLFTYEDEGSGFADFYSPNFTPAFEATFDDPDLQARAEEICGDDFSCLFDIALTGDEDFGLTTLEGAQELEVITNASQPVVCDPPCQNGSCADGNVCRCSEGYSGDRCDQEVVVPCDAALCPHGGTCTERAGSFSCACRSGYSGSRCENGPDLDSLSVRRAMEYPRTSRTTVSQLLAVWRAAPAGLVNSPFLINELERRGLSGYSLAVDSGSVIYKFEADYLDGDSDVVFRVTEYQ